jgi:hypothetical protein
MKAMKKFNWLLALLLLGSTSSMAQTDINDPFPEPASEQSSTNMTVCAQVFIDGVLQEEGIVAVYAGDEIRGKASIGSNKHIAIVTAWGNGGEALHFRVFAKGAVIEVDQGLTYTADGVQGDPNTPYPINLPSPVTTKLTAEGYATTCLPFNARIPNGVAAFYTTGLSDDKLLLEKVTGGVLPKETGVLVKGSGESIAWGATVAEPTADVSGNKFTGTLEATTVSARSVLTLGYTTKDGEKKLGFWLFTGSSIAANRAYVADAAGSRGVTFDDVTPTAIAEVPFTDADDAPVYDLQGRRVSVQGPGLYIRNGRKYIVR